MYLLLVQWTQFKFSYISKNLTRDGLKVIFFSFFSLYKQVLDNWVSIKEMYYWRAPLRLFSSNHYREQREFIQIKPRKTILFLRQWADLYSFSKVFYTGKCRSKFYFFLLLRANESCLNCLAMVNIIISLFPAFVFWKQLIYLFIVLNY